MKNLLLFTFCCWTVIGFSQSQFKPILKRGNTHTDINKLSRPDRPNGLPTNTDNLFNQINVQYQTMPFVGKSMFGVQDFKVLAADGGLPTMIEGMLPAEKRNENASLEVQSFSYLNEIKQMMQIANPDKEFALKSQEVDENGNNHIRFQQVYKGIKVWGSEIILHQQKGELALMNGRYFATADMDVTPALSIDNAEVNVKNTLGSKFEPIAADKRFLLGGDQIRTELVVFYPENEKNPVLTYHVIAFPNVLHKMHYFVDAKTGAIVHSYSDLCSLTAGHIHNENTEETSTANPTTTNTTTTMVDGPAVATALDLFGTNRSIGTYLKGTTYYMINSVKSMFNSTQSVFPDEPVGVLWTINAMNTSPANQSSFNYDHFKSSNNTWSDQKSVSAHYNASLCFDYWKNTFSRNSINGKGGNIVSLVNVADDNGSGMDNAYWNGEAMFYGNGKTAFGPLAKALDVAGHEMTHGVVQNTANLTYQGESGALNESFADVFGAMIDRDDWRMGEDVVKLAVFPSGALRDLSDPHNGTTMGSNGWQPRTVSEKFTGTADNGGVHINSGIPNYAFYLFANNANVGKLIAEKVYYQTLTKYLTASSKFVDLRASVIQSVKDLYPNNANVLAAANSAFDAVGIAGSGGSTTGSNYQNDIKPNPGADFLMYTDDGGTKILVASPPTNTAVSTISTTPILSKPSATDNGSEVVFVGKDNKLYYITLNWTTGAVNQILLDQSASWRNAIFSKDGNKIAGVTTDNDNIIYVYDFVSQKWNAYVLYNPTTAQGINNQGVKYSDAMEFDLTGQNIVYDSYNELIKNNVDLSYWDVGIINVYDNKTKTKGTGIVQKLFSDLPEKTSLGNPTFAKNSPYVVALDYIDESKSKIGYQILGANIEKQTVDLIYDNTAEEIPGAPNFSKNDDKVVFDAKITGTTTRIVAQINVTGKIKGVAGTEVILRNPGRQASWNATGSRVLSDTKNPSFVGDLNVYPNPFTDALNVDLKSFKGAEVNIKVYNSLGVLITNIHTRDQEYILNTVNFQNGLYLIEASNGTERRISKVIK
jgi:bacillolysin